MLLPHFFIHIALITIYSSAPAMSCYVGDWREEHDNSRDTKEPAWGGIVIFLFAVRCSAQMRKRGWEIVASVSEKVADCLT